jgi:serine/threonine protein kinase
MSYIDQDQEQEQEEQMVDVPVPQQYERPRGAQMRPRYEEDVVFTVYPDIPLPTQPCNQDCMVIDKDCVKVYAVGCKGPWIIDKLIAKGAYGQVYSLIGKDNYALKHISATRGAVINEVLNHITAAKHGLAPSIVSLIVHADTNDNMNASIIMSKLERTMLEYLNSVPHDAQISTFEKCLHIALDLLNRLSSIHIYHMDARLDNYMIKDDTWYLIDYGSSIKRPSTEDIYHNYVKMFDSFDRFLHKYQHTPNYTKMFKIYDDIRKTYLD